MKEIERIRREERKIRREECQKLDRERTIRREKYKPKNSRKKERKE